MVKGGLSWCGIKIIYYYCILRAKAPTIPISAMNECWVYQPSDQCIEISRKPHACNCFESLGNESSKRYAHSYRRPGFG